MTAFQMLAPAIILLLLTGSGNAFDAMDRHYIFFPERTLHATPDVAGLTFEEVHFPAADGVRLHGWFLPGKPGRPLLLFAHGNAGNISHRIDNLVHFQRIGLTVFIFDYRGYGQSEGQITEVGSYRDMRGAIAWAKKKGWTPRQMIYFGRSLGAAVALQLALEEPPAGLVLESAFTSVARMGWHHRPLTFALLGWWAISSRCNNLEKINRLQCPLLLFQGERDSIVPPKMAHQLFDRAPEPKTLYLMPDANHNNTYTAGGPLLLETVASFYKHPLSLKVGASLGSDCTVAWRLGRCASVTIGCQLRIAFYVTLPLIPYSLLTKLFLDATSYQGYIGEGLFG